MCEGPYSRSTANCRPLVNECVGVKIGPISRNLGGVSRGTGVHASLYLAQWEVEQLPTDPSEAGSLCSGWGDAPSSLNCKPPVGGNGVAGGRPPGHVQGLGPAAMLVPSQDVPHEQPGGCLQASSSEQVLKGYGAGPGSAGPKSA
jgi:hypothetical protein